MLNTWMTTVTDYLASHAHEVLWLAVIVCVVWFITALLALVWRMRLTRNKKALEALSDTHQRTRELLVQTQQEKEVLATKVSQQAHVIAQKETNMRNSLNEKHQMEIALGQLTVKAELEQKHHAQYIEALTANKDALRQEFEGLSAKIFKAQQKDFSQVAQVELSPMKEQMLQFKEKMENLNRQDAKDREQLRSEIVQLQKANQKISEEAINLTQALTTQSKTRGLWGEAVLERVLESSGLRKGFEYETQVSFCYAQEDTRQAKETTKRYFPDVVVYLPEDKHVVVDAKVVLLDYQNYVNANEEADKAQHLKKFVNQLKAQIKALSEKPYAEISEQASEFVLLFIPVEGAFHAALEADDDLFESSVRKSIILTSPSTLLVCLKMIDALWKTSRQNENAKHIAELSGKLYDQMALMLTAFEEIGQRIDKAKEAYDKTLNRLSNGNGNVLKRAVALKELGAKSSKNANLLENVKDTKEMKEIKEMTQTREIKDR